MEENKTNKKEARTPDGLKIEILKRENRRLNRFRNFVLWVTVFAAGIYSIIFMARAAMPGHWWEAIISLLLIGYMILFLIANGD